MQQEQQSSPSSQNTSNDQNGQTNDSSDVGEEDGEQFYNDIDTTLLEWITANKLTFIKQILLAQQIALTEIASLSHHQRRQFVDSLQIENPIFEKRLLNAVLLLNEDDSNENDDTYNKNNDINYTIQKKKEYIDNSIKNVNDCMEVLEIQMKTNHDQIEQIYNEVIVAANKHKKNALDTISQVYDMKFAVLKVKLSKFKKMQQRIEECKDSSDTFKQSENIMDIIQNTDIIQLKITNDNIDEYIKNILYINDIYSMMKPPKINVTDIEKDCISINILYDMNDYDLNITKYEIKYYQMYDHYDKGINGHKYDTQTTSVNIDKSNNNTKYKLSNLKSATKYAISARLYSSLLSKWGLFCKNIHIKTNKYIHYDGRVILKDKIKNDSYVNCVIHCLSNTIDLKNYFLSLKWKKLVGNNNNLTNVFGNILLDIWSNRHHTISHTISQFITNNMNNMNGMNNDPFKLLVFLLETLHSDLNVKKQKNKDMKDGKPNRSIQWKQYINNNQSKIVELFDFQYKTDITCIQCKKHFINYNMYSYLSFPINKTQRKSFIIDIFHRGLANYNDLYSAYNNNTNKPVRHIFHYSPYGSMKDLAKIIAKRYGVKRQFVLFYENNNMKVVREYEHKMLIKKVPNHMPFSCYILKDWNGEITAEQVKKQKITLWLARLCHGIKNGKHHNHNHNHKSHHLFGMPFVLSFISTHTNKDIYKHVYERLYIWLGIDYLPKPPKISTRQGPQHIENEMKTYDIEWNQILYKKLPFKLKLVDNGLDYDAKNANDDFKAGNDKNISDIPINDTVFDTKLYVKSKHADILIEWKSSNIYERIKKVMNKVIVDTEYSKWKKLKNSHNINGNNWNLYDLFESYLSKKRFGIDFGNHFMNGNGHSINNFYYCSRCKKQQKYTKKIDICTFPKYLTIHLQRNKDRNKPKYVECPLNGLNLTKYKMRHKNNKNNSMELLSDEMDIDPKQKDILVQLSSFDDEQTVEPMYDLYAVVSSPSSMNNNNHKYSCYIKSNDNDCIINQWYHFNYDQITQIDESQIISPSTYLLFYKKH